MPARVRRLTPSSERAPTGRRIASRISPSVTDSQRQMMLPYAGSRRISSFRSSIDKVEGFRISFRRAMKSSFSLRLYFFCINSAIYTPIAGDAVKPGLSMPAQSKKPGASSGSPRMKSPPSSCARKPAKEVMTCRVGRSLTLSADFSITLSMPSAKVAVHSLSSISTAVGPTMVLPWTVGVTRTPLPSLVGS